MTYRFLFSSCLALLASGCIINTTDDGSSSSTSAGPSSTSGGGSSSAGDEETGSTEESTGAGSSSGGFEPDCSMCNANVDPDPLCHSAFNPATGACECDAGYEYETTDPDDFTCILIGGGSGGADCEDPNSSTDVNGNCVCNEGYEWCSDDPTDLSCCEMG